MTMSVRLIRDPEGLNTASWPVHADHLITPTEQFFTRSHAAVPRIDAATWRLEIGGLVDRPGAWSLVELGGTFPRHEVAATLVCAGLRRDEFLSVGALPGELPWGPEPASTGRWSGVALRDLLRAAGVDERARHVELTGLDQVERQGERFGFGGSIELAKAMSAEVLLATELNGSPLPPAHGFPLRAVVPGWIGARSVKWLGRIVLREDPSRNYFQSKAYRLQRTVDPQNPRDVSAGTSLSGVPLNTVIVEPQPGQVVAAGPVHVRGWAMGRSGSRLVAIEVSAGGDHWIRARISAQGEPWTWTFWEIEVGLPPGEHIIMARATDSTGGAQPATVREVWNVKGYNNNAWHRVAVRAE